MKRKVIIISILSILIIIAGTAAFYNFVLASNRLQSPNGEYLATYNRLTETVTVSSQTRDIEWRIQNGTDPEFLWSPNSRQLVIITTYSNGMRLSNIMEVERNSSVHVPSDVAWLGQAAEFGVIHADSVEVTQWLDDNSVAVQFSWFNAEQGKTVSGQYVFIMPDYEIKELTIND